MPFTSHYDFHQHYWHPTAIHKLLAFAEFLFRLLAWPLTCLEWLFGLPYRFTRSEPEDFTPGGDSLHSKHHKIVLSRYVSCFGNVSLPVYIQLNAWNVVLELLHLFALAELFETFRYELVHLAAFFTGRQYKPGMPYSLANLLRPSFTLSPATITSALSSPQHHDSLQLASFLCKCCSIVYESPDVVNDIASTWGFQVVDVRNLSSQQVRKTGSYIADVSWLIITNETHVVLVFRGADPLHQLHRCSEVPATLTDFPWNNRDRQKTEEKKHGKVNQFLYKGLMQPLPGRTSAETVAQHIVRKMLGVENFDAKRLFVVGHSLGGSFAQLMALHLHENEPQIVKKASGEFKTTVYTYGSSAVCDIQGAKTLDEIPTYRYILGTDIIARLPPVTEYKHSGKVRLVTVPWVEHPWKLKSWFPARLCVVREEDVGKEVVEQCMRREDWLPVLTGLWKNLAGENDMLAIVARFTAGLALPGFADHLINDNVHAFDVLLRE